MEYGEPVPAKVRQYYQGPLPAPLPAIQHLVCPCNSVWMSILPPPPCPYHDITYAPIDYVAEVEELNKLLESLDDNWLNQALAISMGPELVGTLLVKLLWPLLGDSDE